MKRKIEKIYTFLALMKKRINSLIHPVPQGGFLDALSGQTCQLFLLLQPFFELLVKRFDFSIEVEPVVMATGRRNGPLNPEATM